MLATEVEAGKICWNAPQVADRGAACADWCLPPQYAAANPGGRLDRCPGNLCQIQGGPAAGKAVRRAWGEGGVAGVALCGPDEER